LLEFVYEELDDEELGDMFVGRLERVGGIEIDVETDGEGIA